MAVQMKIRSSINLDPPLFPHGVQPGNLIELQGNSGSGKTFLITHLIARFLVSQPEQRVILIDTRNHFNMQTFQSILKNLKSESSSSGPSNQSQLQSSDDLIPYIERLTIIRCFTPDDLLFCLGPNQEGQLEKMLIIEPKFSIVFVDSLDSFTYCASMSNVESSKYPDFIKYLKRSVEATKTPVIYSMIHPYQRKRPKPSDNEKPKNESTCDASSSSDASSGDNKTELETRKLFSNIDFEPYQFTHSISLEALPIPKPNILQRTFFGSANLRSRNNPNMSLSGANHRVKFSILSGMLKWEV